MKERWTHQKWSDDIDLSQEYGYSHIYKRLYEYEDLEEQGLIVRLPCKVGEWVYGCAKQINRVIHGVVYKITVDKRGVYYTTYENDGLQEYWLDYVYKTQEEAEARLKELRGGV